MNKNKLLNVAMVALPALGLMAASTPTAVMVFDPSDSTTVYCSYFDLIEGYEWAVILPLAGLFCGVCLSLASIQCFVKSEKWLRGIAVVAFLSMTLAVLPIMMKGQRVILPNVVLPITMLIQTLLAVFNRGKLRTWNENKSKGPRLNEKN